MAISNAISQSAKAATVGYQLTTGDFSETSPNLPMRVAVLSEINTAKTQTLTPFAATSESAVISRMGAGSPAHRVYNILKPPTGGGLQGIPIDIFPVAKGTSATATTATLTVTGTATAAVTHYLVIAGRTNVDGQSYVVNIAKNDTPTAIAAKYAVAINAVLGAPVTATSALGVVTITAKWSGISSIFTLTTETGGVDGGVSYAVSITAGTVVGVVADALAKFENTWYTFVINPYGDNSTVLDALESVNGRPDPTDPTGKYAAQVFKPFLAFFSKSTTDPITDASVTARAAEVTNVFVPAPNVSHFPFEVAADAVRRVAKIAQDTPHLDYIDKSLSNTIVGSTTIGNLASWSYRDLSVKAGLSTVDMIAGLLVIKDLITTYNPTTEVNPQFRYVRNLIVDWNIQYAYRALENQYVVGKTLIPDGTITNAENTISPKTWKGILYQLADDLANRGLIVEPDFFKNSLQVGISATNPDRFETFFRYKRSGVARIASTTVEAGFYYGDTNNQ